MDWSEDFKFSIKKNLSKKGRRAGKNNTPSSPEKTDNQESSTAATTTTTATTTSTTATDMEMNVSTESSETLSRGPPKSKKFSVWSDSGIKSGKLKGNNKNLIEQERFNIASISSEMTSEDDIPIIPDLDDIQDELLMNEVVEPPPMSVNRVTAFKELNSDLLQQSSFSSLEDIDLNILTKCLPTQMSIEEHDEIWDWEQVFTEVSAEIHADLESSKYNKSEELQTSYVK